MLIRKPDQSVINKLEEAQVKLDTVSVCLDKATNSLDSVIVSLGRTGLKAAALDREVNAISRSNEIRKTASGKQINEIRSKIQDDQQKLQLLQKELKTLK